MQFFIHKFFNVCAEKAEYNLLRVQARSNAGLDISTDTAIIKTLNYFIQKNDLEKAALACYYAGYVLHSQGKEAEAIEYYLQADDFAQYTGNNKLIGRIKNRIGMQTIRSD